MPIYEYKCLDCDVAFELLRKMHDDSPVHCAACASMHTEKLLSLSAFHLKGSGWAHDSYGVAAESPRAASTESDA